MSRSITPVIASSAIALMAWTAHAASREDQAVDVPSIEAAQKPKPAAPAIDSRRGMLRSQEFEAFAVPDYKVEEAFSAKIQEEIALLSKIAKRTRDPNRRADILLRIADDHWLDGRAKYFRQMEQYNRQYDLYMSGKLKKRPVKPEFSGATSFRIYQEIIQTAPNYERMDEVLFRAGFHGSEIGNQKLAFDYYQQLVSRFPKSRYRVDAHMEMGEYYFTNRRFDEAIRAFNTVLSEPSKVYNFALYKLAWCFYNQGKVRPSMQIMQRVVVASKGVKNEIELRDEALKDLVLFYSDLGLVDEAQQYFVSIGEPDYAVKVLQKLANIYFEQARYAKAIETIQKLLATSPLGDDTPRYHSKLIESYEKSQDLPRAVNEMNNFIVTYQPNSSWSARNSDIDAREYASERSEVYARFMAKKYHEQAQRTAKSNPEESTRNYGLAVEYYKRYLDRFADHRNAYDMRFLYAELLFKNKSYAESARQFEAVAKYKKGDKYRKPAWTGMIDALTRLEEIYFKDLEAKGIKKKGAFEPIQLSPYAEQLIAADQTVVQLYPKDPQVSDTLLHRGQLYYNYNQFDPAQKAFFAIVKTYPQSAASNTARNLILDIYNIRKDWVNLEKWAGAFLQEKSFATPENRAFLLKLIQGSIFQRAKEMEDKKQFVAAAQTYTRLSDNYPDSEYADKALFNAAIAYINADASDPARATAQRFLQKYPNSEMVPKMMLALASYFDDQLDYEHAAEHYEYLAEKDPKSPYAADALFNAGLYRENLKQFTRALEDYDLYLKKYAGAKDAAEIFFARGLIFEKLRNWKEASAVFRAFPLRYGADKKNKGRVIESWYRYGQATEKLRDRPEATRAYQSAVALYRKYNQDPSLAPNVGGKYAAQAHMELLAPDLEEYEAIRLRMPQRVLAAALERKAALLKKLKDRYLEIITYGDAEVGVEALYRIGSIYQQFSQALFNAPIPKELNPEEVQLYQQKLQNSAAPIEQKAIEGLEKAVKKAFELEVYGPWTIKAFDALTQFKPEEYPTRRGYPMFLPNVVDPWAPYEKTAEGAK